MVCCNFLLGPVVWNRLSSSAHHVQTLSSLKSQLKTHLRQTHLRFEVQLNTHCVVHSGGLSGRSYQPITAKGHTLDLLLLLTCSLPWWHVKTTNTSVICFVFVLFWCCFAFFFALPRARIFFKKHRIESRSATGREIYCLQACSRSFQPGSCTVWGSEEAEG